MILGHGGEVFFFLSRCSFFGREGGKNKEESKIVNVSSRAYDGYTLAMLAVVLARNPS